MYPILLGRNGCRGRIYSGWEARVYGIMGGELFSGEMEQLKARAFDIV
jgi:hypothetical protein